MKKTFFVLVSIMLISCSKNSSNSDFELNTFNSSIRQSSSTGKSNSITEIITTINGTSHTLNLEEDFFYDENEDEYVHLIQQYRVEFEVEESFVSVIVFFDIMTNRDTSTIVDGIPDGLGGVLPTANTMTININGEDTVVSVVDATVNYPEVSYDDGKYSFNISL